MLSALQLLVSCSALVRSLNARRTDGAGTQRLLNAHVCSKGWENNEAIRQAIAEAERQLNKPRALAGAYFGHGTLGAVMAEG